MLNQEFNQGKQGGKAKQLDLRDEFAIGLSEDGLKRLLEEDFKDAEAVFTRRQHEVRTLPSVPGSWVGAQRHSFFLTASRMVIPQDPSTDHAHNARFLHVCS